MSTEFYSRLAETSSVLLKKYGRPVTLRVFTPGGGGSYDPNTGTAVANSQPKTKDTTRSGLVVDAPQNRVGPQYGTNFKENTLIQDHNKWMYMDADGPAPTLQDFVVLNNVQLKIYDVQVIGPGAVPLLYLLVMRA